MEERRAALRRLPGAVARGAAIAAALAAAGAAACELPPGVRVESDRVAVSYRTVPAVIAAGKPFALEIAACPKPGAGPVSDRVRLDAHMPEHRHGMNYRVKVLPAGAGRYRSEGWLFHMPGRWEFLFDFGSERLTHSVRVE